VARRKAKARPALTMQYFDDLQERAEDGDGRAEEEYRKKAAALAKKVNRQIREFEALGRTSAAFQRVEYFLSQERGSERFSERTKTKNLRDLAEDVEQMMIFASSEGYSLKTAKEEEEQVEKNKGALHAALGEVPDEQIEFIINDMFKTEAWKEFRKMHGKATDLIQQAADAFKRGRTADDLKDAYEEFQNRQDDDDFDITKAWKKFTGGRWTHNNARTRRK